MENNKKELVNIIHDYLNDDDNDENTGKTLHSQILTKEKIMQDLLLYDLLNYAPSIQIENFNDFVEFVVKILNKFHYKIGGFNLEDKDWILVDIDNHRFKLRSNERVLYNSIQKKFYDKELVLFLNNIINYAQKFIDVKKFSISHCAKPDDRHTLCWVVIRMIDNTV
jgi:hypothetical protein